MKRNNIKPLAITLVASGVWDTIAGIMYLFIIGTGRIIDSPHTHTFYSVFLASFFFCFAYLQFISATNIRKYSFIVGSLIIGRVFYVFQLYGYLIFCDDFPSTFWFTGIIDSFFTVLYFVFAFQGELAIKNLFIPSNENSKFELSNSNIMMIEKTNSKREKVFSTLNKF